MTVANAPAFLRLLLAAVVIVSAAAGCGRGTRVDSRPDPLASPTAAARHVRGDWVVVLNPTAVAAGVAPIQAPLRLEVGEAFDATADQSVELSGVLADGDVSDGILDLGRNTAAFRFVTGGFTVDGATGELEVPGPVEWTGALGRDGSMTGQAVAGGRSSPFTARKVGR